MKKDLYKDGYTQNRELSWLSFNERVLNQAKDEHNPLLERLKFVSIFSSNLDEFYRVRVGSLVDLKKADPARIDNKSGLNADGQLKAIYEKTQKLIRKRSRIYKDMKKELALKGIHELEMKDLSKSEKAYLKKYFRRSVAPLLGAQIVDTSHPLPVLQSGTVYAAGMLKYHGKEVFAFAPVPANLPRLIRLPDRRDVICFVHMEDLILANLESLFIGSTVLERMKFIVTRNADMDIDDDMFDEIVDYREKMAKMLKERRKMVAVRMETSRKPGAGFQKALIDHLKVSGSTLSVTETPLDWKYAYDLPDLVDEARRKELSYVPYVPKMTPALDYSKNLFDQVRAKDVLLEYPYESMEPFLLLVREAANDPDVVSIKMTVYRLAKRARLVDYLCLAAENGKEVVVLIELKARFDEQNNIDYSEKLEEAGVHVLYGFEEYKVHSKICLITRVRNGKTEHVSLIATGNFNENTARQYTDLAYLTGRPGIIQDSVAFFRNMMTGRLDGGYRYLMVSPVSLKEKSLELIDREIAKGENGRIVLKMNSITDEDLIAKLSEASRAGVKIDMVVRGISCLLPGVKKRTENIRIVSIVGRYLEHSRVYVFGTGKQEVMYISSADWMTRNTERRVEIAVPIMDPSLRTRISRYLDLCFEDNVRARVLNRKGAYHKNKRGEQPVDSQEEMMLRTVGTEQNLPVVTGKPRQTAQPFKTVYKKKKKGKKNENKD